MTEPVIRVEDLHAEADGRHLVTGVSFTVAAGDILAIVGASGSGKSTTGLALLGEAAAGIRVTGLIEIAGHTVSVNAPPPAGTVGYVPQHPSTVLNPVRRIGAVLHEIARRHPTDGTEGRRWRRAAARRRVPETLRRALLPTDRGTLRRYPHQLSGGQQQRLVLAHALLAGARVLVADEPTTGQDAVTRAEVSDELRGLATAGIAVVLLSHDLDLVRGIADHVLVLRDGQPVESGRVGEVFATPRHDYTRQLVAPRPARTPPAERPADDPPLLSVTDLVAEHRSGGHRHTVLRAVSLDVRTGTCLAVVGRSGSGKTTLARCLAGLHPPRSGTIHLNGRDLPARVDQRNRADLARIQYLFQDARASFDEHRPVLDRVARTAVRLRGASTHAARDAALAMLDRVGLAEAAVTRRPAGLSGGELQRAALARALLAEPEVLICDEITSGLDTVTEGQVLALVDDLRLTSGLTLIVISHDRAVVARLADHVVVLHHGHVVEHGPAPIVLAQAQQPLTRALLAPPGTRHTDALTNT